MPRDRERRRGEGKKERKVEAKGELILAKDDEKRIVRPVSDIDELKSILGEKEKTCQNCGATVKEAYFCNHCGTQFCQNCSESQEQGEMAVYTCPECGKKNYIKKNQ
jgi:predicted RNA-binding Zn-ribbon protein involved in translation (DUF1610 family)